MTFLIFIIIFFTLSITVTSLEAELTEPVKNTIYSTNPEKGENAMLVDFTNTPIKD